MRIAFTIARNFLLLIAIFLLGLTVVLVHHVSAQDEEDDGPSCGGGAGCVADTIPLESLCGADCAAAIPGNSITPPAGAISGYIVIIDENGDVVGGYFVVAAYTAGSFSTSTTTQQSSYNIVSTTGGSLTVTTQSILGGPSTTIITCDGGCISNSSTSLTLGTIIVPETGTTITFTGGNSVIISQNFPSTGSPGGLELEALLACGVPCGSIPPAGSSVAPAGYCPSGLTCANNVCLPSSCAATPSTCSCQTLLPNPPAPYACDAIVVSPTTNTSQWASWGFPSVQSVNGSWTYRLSNNGRAGLLPTSWSWSATCNRGGGSGTFSATTTNPTYWTAPYPVPTVPAGFERQVGYYNCTLDLSGADTLGHPFTCPSVNYPLVDGGVQPSPSPSPSPTPTITPSPTVSPTPTPRQGLISGYVYLVNEASTQNGALTYLDHTESCYTSGVTITARYTARGGGHNQGDLAGSTTFTGNTNCYAGGPYQLQVPGGFTYDVIFDETNALVNSGLTLKYYDYGVNQGFSAPGSKTARVSIP